MFPTLRFSLGVNKALRDAVDRKAISAWKRAEMTRIAGAGLNGRFGRDLIQSGTANNRHSAAALVFARLAVAAANMPGERITAADWRAAARRAIRNAGASKTECSLVLAEMIKSEEALFSPLTAEE